MIYLINANQKKKKIEKERKIVSMHIKSNKTNWSNVVFAKSTKASIGFPKLNETLEFV